MSVCFATYAASADDLLNNYLLANSIKEFAGNLSDIPLRIYVSSNVDAQSQMSRFAGLNVVFREYPAARDFPYAFKPAAASACEADVGAGNVMWLDRHMLVLGPCVNLLLNPLEQFAYKPPSLKLLGAAVKEPINEMWSMAYRLAGVDQSLLFPVYSEVDQERIWSYFSAGHFSFRAEAGIMQKWNALFGRLVDHPDMQPFLDGSVKKENEYNCVFLHQITLTLAVLKNLGRDALKPLPAFYGYPTHLHDKMERYCQASQMDQVHTAFFTYNGEPPKMPASDRLASWIEDQARQFG